MFLKLKIYIALSINLSFVSTVDENKFNAN